ncbi:MAG: hypothetical protein GEV05_25960 [Betaproteobacteria bacterium]|nr:hypothetical protein [Betaproteobacteria bacterium]
MLPDWDADSPELRRNLAALLRSVRRDGAQRKPVTVETARGWQREIMRDLQPEDPSYIGAFRGEPGLELVQVHVDGRYGVRAGDVPGALQDFNRRLQAVIRYLDDLIAPGSGPNADQVAAVVELCAWVNAEWVRIHPFANGNGRTARLWVNCLAMRYGLPAFMPLRPRPGDNYDDAGEQAMLGNWEPTVACFHKLLDRFLDESDSST